MAIRQLIAALAIVAGWLGSAEDKPPLCVAAHSKTIEAGTFWLVRDTALILAHMAGAAVGEQVSFPWIDAYAEGATACLREEFRAGSYFVQVTQFDEPRGETAILYRFAVLDGTGVEAAYFILGRSRTLNAVARELATQKNIGMIFNLDRVTDKNYASEAMFNGEPDYAVIRVMISERVLAMPPP